MLNHDGNEPTFIPVLDNIYLDGINIIGNYTSFETLLYLKHINNNLSV
jgi:hypothetical protein